MEENPGTQERRRISRREFVGLGVAGAGLVLLPGCLPSAGAQQRPGGPANSGAVNYRGHAIAVERRNGRPELFIDGERIVTVDTNGAFRAANFMFSPASTRQELARSIIDYRIALARS